MNSEDISKYGYYGTQLSIKPRPKDERICLSLYEQNRNAEAYARTRVT